MKPSQTNFARHGSAAPSGGSGRLSRLLALESIGQISPKERAELRGLLEHPDCPATAELRRRQILGLLNHREEAHLIARREFPGAGLAELGYDLRFRQMLPGGLTEEEERRLELVRSEFSRLRADC